MDKLMKRKERTGGAPASAGKRGIGRTAQRGSILSLFLLTSELMKCEVSNGTHPAWCSEIQMIQMRLLWSRTP